MDKAAKLLALAERVEALSGPDGAVSKLIFAAVYPDNIPSPVVESGYGWRESDGGWWLATGEDARTPPKTVYPPKWLTSLDAAMSLVPEGYSWTLGQNVHHKHWVCSINYLDDEGAPACLADSGSRFTPALALTAAAVRALAARGDA